MPAEAHRSCRRRNWSRVWLAPALVVAIALIDRTVETLQPSLAVHGLLDELGHLATTAVLLAVGVRLLPRHRRPRPVVIATVLASTVAIDVDHVPAVLGWHGLTEGTPRPYPHSISSLALLAVAAAVLPRRARPFALAALAGIAAHLLRDLGTAPVALWWPVSWSGVEVPHAHYVALMAALAAVDAAVEARGRVVIDLREVETSGGLGQSQAPERLPEVTAVLRGGELAPQRFGEVQRLG